MLWSGAEQQRVKLGGREHGVQNDVNVACAAFTTVAAIAAIPGAESADAMS